MKKDNKGRDERRGRKPKPSISFYMPSQTYGDIKILFSYNGDRYSGGSTYLTLNKDEFAKLKPNGEPKNARSKDNPKLINGILVHELLRVIRNSIEDKIREDLDFGKELSEEYVRGLMNDACSKMFEQLGIWCSNQEWNKRASEYIANFNPLK